MRTADSTRSEPAPGRSAALRWFGSAYRVLASGRLAVLLLTLLLALLLLYLWIPQYGPYDQGKREAWSAGAGTAWRLLDAVGLTTIRHSFWLRGCFLLIFVNLLLCMVRRATAVEGSWSFPRPPVAGEPGWEHRTVAAGSLEIGDLVGLLAARGYRVRSLGGAVLGVRGRYHLVGHWIFHVGLLGLIAAGGFLAVGPGPFRGTVGIGEGEEFSLHAAPYLGVNFPPRAELPGMRFRLETLEVATRGDRAASLAGSISTPEGETGRLGVNRPYRDEPYQVMARSFGFMPGWVVVDGRGRMRSGAWVKLVPFPREEEDIFPIGPGESWVRVRLRPHGDGPTQSEETVPFEATDPRFEATVVFLGETVFEGVLAPEERVPLGNGTEFFFLSEVRRYALVDIIEERGIGLLLVCFGVIVAGLALRYARIRKEILIAADGDGVRISGRSELFEGLFREEMEQMVADLESRAGKGAGEEGTA